MKCLYPDRWREHAWNAYRESENQKHPNNESKAVFKMVLLADEQSPNAA